jgi:hypothetical protein
MHLVEIFILYTSIYKIRILRKSENRILKLKYNIEKKILLQKHLLVFD